MVSYIRAYTHSKLATDEFMGKIQIDHALHHLNSIDLKILTSLEIFIGSYCQINNGTIRIQLWKKSQLYTMADENVEDS